MKPATRSIHRGLLGIFLPLVSHAAPITWGPVESITGPGDIISTGVTSLAGANFGITTGTTTNVSNGSVSVEFKSLRSGQTTALSNGITVAAESSWGNFGLAAGNSNIAGDFGAVLDSNLGIESGAPLDADLTLSGLTIGTTYQIQFFVSDLRAAANVLLQTIEGPSGGVSGAMTADNGTNGTFIVGTFTADDTSQVLTVKGTGADNVALANALTIGTVGGGPDITPPDWTATWPQAEPLSATSLTVRARTNETGNAYYVVLPDGAAAPSAAQVKALTDSTDMPVSASGSLALTAGIEATAPVGSLSPGTTYDVYFVAEDASANLQAAPVPVEVSLISPATVTWGSWVAVADETAIQTPGGYTYGGVNFNGSDTTVGSVAFTGIAQNGSGSTNGVSVATTGFAFQSTGSGNSNVVSAVGTPQTWATVLDRVIGDDNNAASINLSGLTPGTDYTVQFFSSTPDGGINSTTRISSGGVDSPQFGSHTGGQTRYLIASFTATAPNQSFTVTGAEPTFGALVIGVESTGGSTFADWIGGFTGLNGLTGFDDDADGDGLDNGLENFLGTAPNAGNAGLAALGLGGNTFTFSHPQNATPASDVSAPDYTWSTDLVNWNASGASSGGITVNLLPALNTPSGGTTTVTATVVGTLPSRLFVRLAVTQD